jgi:hypothetical protein
MRGECLQCMMPTFRIEMVEIDHSFDCPARAELVFGVVYVSYGTRPGR